jgi:ATP-dependent Clp protease ATP-binding subunit ClpB
MNLARLSESAKRHLGAAHGLAVDSGQAVVEPEHLLLAMLRDDASGLRSALGGNGVDVDVVEEALGQGSKRQRGRSDIRPPSAALEGLVKTAWGLARARQSPQVEPAELLKALLGEGSGSGIKERLSTAGVKAETLERTATSLGSAASTSRDGAKGARNLRKFSRCLTDLALDGNLDPVIGRHREIRRVMQVLSRRVKNNPVLIGKPGVGKSAIVEGLAQRIALGDVPESIASMSIFALDLAAVGAGTEVRSVFDDRLRTCLNEVREANGNYLLFVDDLQAIVRSDGGGVLKAALATGEIRCIGVATEEEYRNHIERDAALERRFQPIGVDEPGVEETVSVLRGLRHRYEAHHDVRITDEALVAASYLAHRFIADRSLPDKAIDLVDEAAAKVVLERDSLPVEVDALERQAREIETEIEGMGLESQRSIETARRLRQSADEVRESALRDRRLWLEQKTRAESIVKDRESLDWHRLIAHTGRGARATARPIAKIERQIVDNEARLAELQRDRRLFKLDLAEEDIAEVVASSTGIPLNKLLEDERGKLLDMEVSLHDRVVGQDKAVEAVSNAVRLARAGMKDPNRPVGSFLFMGPTGVGKTELSRALAEFLFDDESAMVRIDMSEYMEKHTVSRLIGAPPGYIGYDDSGQLTEAIRRRPYAVVLFDEIEKAHPDVFNILLQLMDDGRLTDGHGRTVDFRNAILIMTSNVGGHLYRETLGKKKSTLEGLLAEELRSHFRPEFLNRIDAIVRFDMLALEQIKAIVDIQVRLVNRRLEKGNIRLAVTDGVRSYLAESGFDQLQGARPLKRMIQQEVLEPLALRVLRGEFTEGDVIELAMREGRRKGVLLKKQPKRRSPKQPSKKSSDHVQEAPSGKMAARYISNGHSDAAIDPPARPRATTPNHRSS